MLAALTNLVFFGLLVLGAGAALAPDWSLKAGERLCLGIAAALITIYIAGFGLFVFAGNPAWLWLLPPSAAILVAWRRRKIQALCLDTDLRRILPLFLAFVLWTLGLLALVVSYSGGGWAGDWLEHYQRALVFMHRESPHVQFLGAYSLTSRPPLANVVTAVLMEFSGGRFSDYQIFTSLLGTLFFFPGWLFYRRWRDRSRGFDVLWVLVLMLNPMIAQNTTFAWTKLTCAFWVLSGGYFLLRGVLNEGSSRERIAGFVCLTGGLLTHYSAGPWILAWLVGYAIWFLRHGGLLRSVKETAVIACLCALLALTWFGWAAHTFGWQETGTSNSAAREWQMQSAANHWRIPISNIFNTIIPHPFRSLDRDLIYQASQGGWIRDYFFNIYQTNLPLGVGFAGAFVIIHGLFRPTPSTMAISKPETILWRWFLPFIIVIGILVTTPPDGWGLTHICLQPLVILGLAWIAARLPRLPKFATITFILFLLWDTAMGIILPFAIEATTTHTYASAAPSGGFEVTRLNFVAMINYKVKIANGLPFFSDTLSVPTLGIASSLCLLLGFLIFQLRRETNRPSAGSLLRP